MSADDNNLNLVTDFLTKIDLPFIFTDIDESTFVPGILIAGGALNIDRSKCTYVGDILHEAGHFAVLTPSERKTAHGDVGDAGEMAAMLWSYAAALDIGLDPKVVFHSDGYKGDSDWLLERYAEGTFIGMPVLQWYGLALDPENPITDGPVFPSMLKWRRDEPEPTD
jgi:hypothetical protein